MGEVILYVCTLRHAKGRSTGASIYWPAAELYGLLPPGLKMRLTLSLKILFGQIAYKQTNRVNLISCNIFSVAYKQNRVNQNRVNRELPDVMPLGTHLSCKSSYLYLRDTSNYFRTYVLEFEFSPTTVSFPNVMARFSAPLQLRIQYGGIVGWSASNSPQFLPSQRSADEEER